MRALAQVVACEIHPLNNLRVLRYLTQDMGLSSQQKDAWYAHWIALGLGALEEMLATSSATGRFCHGDSPTLADCCLVPQVFNARRFGCPTQGYPTIERIVATCEQLPAFAQAAPGSSRTRNKRAPWRLLAAFPCRQNAAMRTPSAPAAAESGITILVLALLLSIQPVTTDLYLPALPTLTYALGASVTQGQLTFERPAAGLWLLPAFLGGRCPTAGAAGPFAGRTRCCTPWPPSGNSPGGQHGPAHPAGAPCKGWPWARW